MHLRQIETFYWAARLGSFANAAKRLNATQSAVSMRIHELETRLGVRLFDRTQRAARLTSDGLSLLPFAEQMIRMSEQMVAAVLQQEQVSGYVRVGVAEIIAHTWLPRLLELLKRDYPGIKIEVDVAISYLIEQKLYEGVIDMAMTPCELPATSYVNVDLGNTAFLWMASPKLREVPPAVVPTDLGSLPVILTARGDQHRGAVLHWFTENEVHFRSLTICNTFTVAAAMAKAGLGIALLPVDIYNADIAKGLLRIVKCQPEIPALKLFSSRPKLGPTALHKAVERSAVLASSFHGKPEDLVEATVDSSAIRKRST